VVDADLDAGLADDVIDTDSDRLTGGADADWFLGNFFTVSPFDIITDFQDLLDKKTGL
jgi:Ca2+-binding RTX toxin-like protein